MPTPSSSSARFRDAAELIAAAVSERASPAVTIEVGRRDRAVWAEAFGRLDYGGDADATRLDTIFDLASLTKVIVTASVAMRAVAAGRLDLETPVSELSAEWRGSDRAEVTVRQLLDHSSGLPAHTQLWRDLAAPGEVERAIATTPLDRAPGTAAVYSDLGFILFGILVSRLYGAPLDDLFGPVGEAVAGWLGFAPDEALRPTIAPTERDPWRGRVLRGEVHDENAALLGGIAAHAGLFGTVGAVGAFARLVLETFEKPTLLGSPALMREFAERSRVPGSTRALGWDTMKPTSSCGSRFSVRAIGRTGFTGTSLWIDPERDVYVALLSNRVHPSRTDTRFPALRPRIHDAVLAALD